MLRRTCMALAALGLFTAASAYADPEPSPWDHIVTDAIAGIELPPN